MSTRILLLESEVDEVQTSESQRLRPELREAKVKALGLSKRISPPLSTRDPLHGQENHHGASTLLLRLGVPMHKLEERMQEIFFALAVGAAFGMLLALLIALILVRRITDPVSEMTRVAEAISHGNYAARIRSLPANELGSLGAAINRLAEAVEAEHFPAGKAREDPPGVFEQRLARAQDPLDVDQRLCRHSAGRGSR